MSNNNKEYKALVGLLDDSDETIVEAITNKIKEIGFDMIPYLEEGKQSAVKLTHQQKISKLLSRLKINRLKTDVNNWKQNTQNDLLKGLIAIAKYGKDYVNEEAIHDVLNEIEIAIDKRLADDKDVDIIQVFNEVILKEFNFKGNTPENQGVNASYINKVLEKKSGYPIMLCAIYLLMAKRYNIPLIGINSPRHFILAHIGNNVNVETALPDDLMKNITFFIDPFLQGNIYNVADFKKLLKNAQFDIVYYSSLAASNIDIIKRVMNNVIYNVYHDGKQNTAKRLLTIVDEL